MKKIILPLLFAALTIAFCERNGLEPNPQIDITPVFQDNKLLSEDTITICWSGSFDASGGLQVFFSKDSGLTWGSELELIATLDRSVQVQVPNQFVETEQCRFKIENRSVFLISDTYTIKNLLITKPYGGEIFHQGDTIEIIWKAHPSVSSVAAYLYLSTNAGKQELMLMESASVTTSMPQWPRFTWKIPDTISAPTCYLRIEDYMDPLTDDRILRPFEILPK